MKGMVHNGKAKLNIQFNARQNQVLEEISDDLSMTKAGVLKAALALYEIVLREKRQGNALGIIRNDKVIKEIIGID